MSMEFNIKTETNKLNKFVNGEKKLSSKNFTSHVPYINANIKVKYLMYVLQLTYKRPEIETYLKQLLEKFSIEELNNLGNNRRNILHCMVQHSFGASLNSFEIIINFGIDVNSQDKNDCTPLHCLEYEFLKYNQNIINLFSKHGANLNIMNFLGRTILDNITYSYRFNGSYEIIMTMIDFGARTNNPHKYNNVHMLEFIESYRSSNIKPAIKN